MTMLNNYDLFKNGLFKLFDESIYNEFHINIDDIEPQLKKIDKNNLYDDASVEVIESSNIIELMVTSLRHHEVNTYITFDDLENIRDAFLEWVESIASKYNYEVFIYE